MQMPRLVTLPHRNLEPPIARLQLGIELIGPRLLLGCLELRGGELDVQLLEGALVDRTVRLACVQALDAARELGLQGFDFHAKPLACARLDLRPLRQFGVSEILRLDGAL